MKFQIISHECPDNTYFKTSDVTPYFDEDGNLHIWDGKGTRRSSWGAPSVRTEVSETNGLVVCTVTGWHKHTVSPVGGTYYFVNIKGQWQRKRANAKAVKEALAAA